MLNLESRVELGVDEVLSQNRAMKKQVQNLMETFARAISAEVLARQNATVEKEILQASETLLQPNFECVSTKDLRLLFHIIDEVCLEGQLARAYESVAHSPLQFRLSKRMTSTGGMTTVKRLGISGCGKETTFEIAIGTTPLFQSFGKAQNAKVSGVACTNRLQALQKIMEHEMIHLAEFLCWNDSNCSRARFRKIVRNRFGHLESTHQLHNHRTNAAIEQGIRPGDWVSFAQGPQKLCGRVNRITKRASVLVRDSKGRLYSDGERYTTYYVPVVQLKKIENAAS